MSKFSILQEIVIAEYTVALTESRTSETAVSAHVHCTKQIWSKSTKILSIRQHFITFIEKPQSPRTTVTTDFGPEVKLMPILHMWKENKKAVLLHENLVQSMWRSFKAADKGPSTDKWERWTSLCRVCECPVLTVDQLRIVTLCHCVTRIILHFYKMKLALTAWSGSTQ